MTVYSPNKQTVIFCLFICFRPYVGPYWLSQIDDKDLFFHLLARQTRVTIFHSLARQSRQSRDIFFNYARQSRQSKDLIFHLMARQSR